MKEQRAAGHKPIVTWALMALSAVAAFVLPSFAVDPVEGAKPLVFVIPTIGFGLLGAVAAIVQRFNVWALVSAAWGLLMLVVVFIVAVLVEWATGGPHL